MRYQHQFLSCIWVTALMIVTALPAMGQTSEVKKLPLPVLDEETTETLRAYLRQNYKTPEDYILAKFKDHQIVFVGEYHRIQHDVLLIQRMIPLLYKAGIYNLGIEFGVHGDQNRVDELINAETYDEQAAREIMFDFACYWGYKEYMDIYRAAWELNHTLASGAPRFRVVNLNATTDWSFIESEDDRQNATLMSKVFPEGDADKVMAETILREFVDKSEKALIYSGIHHAFTRYKQPVFADGKFVRFIEDRMGNLVYQRLGAKVFTVYLHAPWSDKTYENELYPGGGVIDALFAKETSFTPVGFDLAGTPFGELAGPGSLYEEGYTPFTLSLFADGYIFTKPISQYQGVTVDEKFITEGNLDRAVEQMPNPAYRPHMTSPETAMEGIRSDAEIARRFSQFH